MPAGLDETGVQRFETRLLDAFVANNGGFPYYQECGDACSLVDAVGGPDFDDSLEEGLEKLAEREEIWYELKGGVEEMLLGGGVGEERKKVHKRLRVRFKEWGERAIFLRVRGHADLARSRLFDGEMVL